MNTDPTQFQRFLTLIPDEIKPLVWFIPLGMGLKSPDIPKGESAKDEKYRLTPEKAHERIKKGINVGIYATPGGLLFLDADTDKGNIVLPEEIRRTIPATLTIKTRNGGLQYYFINNGAFKNKVHTYNGKNAGEIRADWYYVLAPGSYVKPDEDAGKDAEGVYKIINDAPIIKLDKLPAGITVKEDIPKKEIEIKQQHTWKNDLGLSLYEIRKKDDKLDRLLKGANDCGYPSRSEADMAAAQKLWFWRFNESEIAGILREYRPYEKTERDDYLKTTTSNIKTNEERYNPNYKDGSSTPILNYPEMDLKDILALQQKENNRRLDLSLPDDHFLSGYVKWLKSLSDGYEEYHILGGLWILSALARRKVILRLKQGDVRPNLWLFLLGKSTTSRKSTSVNKSREMYEVATGVTLYNEDYSIEGYLETLSLFPVMANVRDEAAGLMAKYHKKYNEGIFELDCQLYDGQNVKKTLASGSKKEPKTYEVKNPYITKLYASTPDNFARYMSVDDFLCGYGFRFLYAFPNYEHARMSLTIRTDEDVRAWAQTLENIKTLHNEFLSIIEEKEFSINDDAMQYYDAVISKIEAEAQKQNNDMLNSAIGRAEAHILKIAMLLELGKKEMSFTIFKQSIEVAASMVINYFLPTIMEVIERLQEDIKNNQIEKIISVLRRLGGIAAHTKVLHDTKMKSKDFNECISTMFESKTIDIVKDINTKITYYRLLDYHKNLTNPQNPLNLLIPNNSNNREISETSNKFSKLNENNTPLERGCKVGSSRDTEILGISGIPGFSVPTTVHSRGGSFGHVGASPLSPYNKEVSRDSPTTPTAPTNSSNTVTELVEQKARQWEQEHRESITALNLTKVTFNLKPHFPAITADELALILKRYAKIPGDEKISFISIRALIDVPEFAGFDGKIYQLHKGALVRLPKVNADALIKRGAAEQIKLQTDPDVLTILKNLHQPFMESAKAGKLQPEYALEAFKGGRVKTALKEYLLHLYPELANDTQVDVGIDSFAEELMQDGI